MSIPKLMNTKFLTVGCIVFKDGTELQNVNCYIGNGFLIVETDEVSTFYNMDEIKKMEQVTPYKSARQAQNAGIIW